MIRYSKIWIISILFSNYIKIQLLPLQQQIVTITTIMINFLPPRFFKILLDYYVKHDQFIPMLQLIEASKTSIPYDPSYLILIAKHLFILIQDLLHNLLLID